MKLQPVVVFLTSYQNIKGSGRESEKEKDGVANSTLGKDSGEIGFTENIQARGATGLQKAALHEMLHSNGHHIIPQVSAAVRCHYLVICQRLLATT